MGGVLRNLLDLDFRQELRWLIEAGLQSALQRPVSVSLTQALTAPAPGGARPLQIPAAICRRAVDRYRPAPRF